MVVVASQVQPSPNQEEPTEKNYHDFMTKFEKEAEYFKKPRTQQGKPFPRVKTVIQRSYDNWIAQVVDPVTGEYHKDENGNGAQYKVNHIVRIRLVDGSEKLYSHGQLVGANSFKDRKTFPCDKPEVHEKTNFSYSTTLDNNRQIRRYTTGPSSVEEVYDMDFTEENANKLWAMKKDRSVKLTVVDQLSMEPHAVEIKGFGYGVEQEALEKAFTMFKTAQFDYLYNWDYIKAPKSKLLRELEESAGISSSDATPDPSPNTKTKFEPTKVK